MTCLCLTRNRRQWLPQAIRCFQSQTYRNKELLIIADGENVRDIVAGAQESDERVRLIEIPEGYRIGQKRNFGADQAAGEIIAHWDDDDFSAPERLGDQVQRLLASGKAVTAYCAMYFRASRAITESEWWFYEGKPGRGIGTSLLYRKEWWRQHQFQAIQIQEDSHFMHAAAGAKEFVTAEAGTLMAATIHAGNTSKRNLNPETYRVAPEFAGVPGMEFPCG